jgi:hypothetical protein
MFMTIMTFFIVGIIFVILHFFINGIWAYYVPASLIALSVWLKVIQPAWSAEYFQTLVAKTDPSAAAFYVTIISVIYGIVSLVLGNWIPAIICLIALILSLTMRFQHPY